MPGTSVPSWAPRRRAIRRVTRTVYSVSSFVPRRTWSTMVTAAIRSDASRASPKPSTRTSSGSSSPAMMSSAASAARTSRKPVTSMNGRRSAARIGGSTALRTPMSAATRKAAPVVTSSVPGTSHTETATATAATTQASRKRTTPIRGVSGCQPTRSPYPGAHGRERRSAPAMTATAPACLLRGGVPPRRRSEAQRVRRLGQPVELAAKLDGRVVQHGQHAGQLERRRHRAARCRAR